MNEQVIELVAFKTKPGIERDAVERAADASARLLEQQPGFLSRRLAVSDDGEWADMIEWTDRASAERAAAVFLAAPEAAAFMAILDLEQTTQRHYHPILRSGEAA